MRGPNSRDRIDRFCSPVPRTTVWYRKLRDITIGVCCISRTDLKPGTSSVSEVIADVKKEVLSMWQSRWSSATKGRTTFCFFRNVSDRLNAQLTLNHCVIQFQSGYGDIQAKLFRFALVPDDRCRCSGAETLTHVLFDCPKYGGMRQLLRRTANSQGLVWPVEEADLVSNEYVYQEFRKFARTVLKVKGSRTHNTVNRNVN